MKKIICFILILSFILPFLPLFNIPVSAATVSSNSSNAVTDILQGKLETALTNDGIVVSTQYFVNNVWDYVGQGLGLLNATKESVQAYLASNNLDANFAFNTVYTDFVLNNIENDLPYYIYDFININDFFTYYQFNNYPSDPSYQGVNSYKLALENACSDSNYVYFLSSTKSDYQSVQYLYATTLIKVPRDFFDDNYLVLSSGQFSGIQNFDFQSFRVPRDGNTVPTFTNFNISSLGFYDGLSFINSDSYFSFRRFYGNYSGNYYQGNEVLLTVPDYRIFTGLINNSSSWFSSGSFNGTAFIYSGDSFSLLVFRSSNLCQDFISGNSDIYKFSSNITIPEGSNIDY